MAAASSVWPKPVSRNVILLYHAVGDGPWAITNREFRAQMAWLRDEARIVTLEQALQGNEQPGLQVAVTFDDGYRCIYENAFPIQEELGIPGAVFLNSGLVGDQTRTPSDVSKGHYPGESFLLWHEVMALREAGWTLGSHGSEHLDLTVEPDAIVRSQLLGSKREIESRLSVPCDLFAYTWGRSTSHLRALVAEAGYRYAMAGYHAPVRANADPMGIPRINIAREYSLSDFKAIVRGDWDYLGWSQRAKDHRA
ncbi:MAG: polysaccharide deacetylase family protein [Proteobacteria bacterium]|nr:polysaccharide deacetylase family protein [Pseudomonadota bacterium]